LRGRGVGPDPGTARSVCFDGSELEAAAVADPDPVDNARDTFDADDGGTSSVAALGVFKPCASRAKRCEILVGLISFAFSFSFSFAPPCAFPNPLP
jgi:hypothetical protein